MYLEDMLCDYIYIRFRGQNFVVVPMKRSPIPGDTGSEIEKMIVYTGGLGKVDELVPRGMHYEPPDVVRVLAGRVPDWRECVKISLVTKGWFHERAVGWPSREEEIKVVKPL